MNLRPLVLAAPLLAAAALAAPAGATTYCVHQTGTCAAGTADRGADLQQALFDAAAKPDADRVEIGPGGYSGGFIYSGPGPLEIVGAGRDRTVLEGEAGDFGSTSLVVNGANVSHLTAHVVPAEIATGIIATNGSVLRDVAVDTSGTGKDRRGVALLRDASLVESTVTMGAGETGVRTHPDGRTAVVSDSIISGGTGVEGVSAPSGGTIVRRSTISGSLPLRVNGVSLEAENLVLRATGAGNAAAQAICTNGRSSKLSADHLTIDGGGGENGVLATCSEPARIASVTLANTVVTGARHAVARAAVNDGAAHVAASFSDLHPAAPVEIGTGTTSLSDTLDVEPGFAPDGLRLAAGSPLVDAGAPGPAAQPTDRDGNPRLAGDRQDIGAFESAPVAAPPEEQPPVTATPPAGGQPPVTAPSGVPAAPVTDAALLRELRRTLRGRRGHAYEHRFLLPATLRITWVARGRVLARARVVRAKTGVAKLRVKPTRRGAKLLRSTRRVSVRASLAPQGRRALRLKRRALLRHG